MVAFLGMSGARWWYFLWQSAGVGNFTDDVVLLILTFIIGHYISKFIKRELSKIHEKMDAHHAKMEKSQQVLHDHLGTGHNVND